MCPLFRLEEVHLVQADRHFQFNLLFTGAFKNNTIYTQAWKDTFVMNFEELWQCSSGCWYLKKRKQRIMHDLYHGQDKMGDISHVHLLSSRYGIFEDMWEEYDTTCCLFNSEKSDTQITGWVGMTTYILTF